MAGQCIFSYGFLYEGWVWVWIWRYPKSLKLTKIMPRVPLHRWYRNKKVILSFVIFRTCISQPRRIRPLAVGFKVVIPLEKKGKRSLNRVRGVTNDYAVLKMTPRRQRWLRVLIQYIRWYARIPLYRWIISLKLWSTVFAITSFCHRFWLCAID